MSGTHNGSTTEGDPSENQGSRGRHPVHRSDRHTLSQPLPATSAVIYSIFTEGHTSAAAPTLVRGDVCDEAIWLAGLLADLVPEAQKSGVCMRCCC